MRTWETQLRFFSRHYRCVAFNARGYEPSDVPADDAAYDYRHFADDIAAVIRSIGAERAHVVGLSTGAYAALMFGIRHADNASALVVAGCGSGAIRDQRASFAIHVEEMARCLEQGSERAAEEIGMSATRIQLLLKDPRGWSEFVRHLGEHSPDGSARTLRKYQGSRPSLFDFEAEFRGMTTPVLLAVGDEDEPCLEVNLFLNARFQSWVCGLLRRRVTPSTWRSPPHSTPLSVLLSCGTWDLETTRST